MEMIESIITKIEYLTSRQLTSCEKGNLVKRNLNLLPVRVKATFCHPFKISFRIKIKSRRMIAIFKPVKSSIFNTNGMEFQIPLTSAFGLRPCLALIPPVAGEVRASLDPEVFPRH